MSYVRIRWAATGETRIVTLLDYLAMPEEDLAETVVALIEPGGQA